MRDEDNDTDSSRGKGPMDDRGVHWGRYLLTGICVATAIGRCFAPKDIADRLDWQFVLLVAAAGSLLMLPYLSKVKFGKGGVDIGFITPKERRAISKFGIGGKKNGDGKKSVIPRAIAEKFSRAIEQLVSTKPMAADEANLLKENLDIVVSDDPQKGMWGGVEERGGYRLGARVDRIEGSPDWFGLQLKVARIDKNAAPGQRVRFHLHPTFLKTEAEVPIEGDEAALDLVAWGAFTVGAEVLDAHGRQLATLELDLSKLPDAPKEFRDR